MAILKSTMIYNGDLDLTGTITLPSKNSTWLYGFNKSPINITKAIDSSNFNPWLIQCNTAFDYYNYISFGTFKNDITLVGTHRKSTDIDDNTGDDVIFADDIDTDCMVRWWFDSNSGGFGIRGSKKRLNDKNCYYIHSNNYTNYMPKLDGTSATGDWKINISGNAAGLSKILAVEKGGTGNSSMTSGCLLVKGTGIGTFSSLKGGNSIYGVETTTSQAKIGVWNIRNTVQLGTNKNAGIYCDAENFTDGVTNPSDSVYGNASKWLIYINTSGTVTANTSDKRRKFYIEDMPENETRVLLNIPVRNFIYKEDIGHNDLEQNGIFAQDLREAMKANNIGNRPWLQWEYNDNDRDDVYYDINFPEKDDMTYSVSYNHMVPALIKGWQMQNKEIEELEKKLAILRIKKIESEV